MPIDYSKFDAIDSDYSASEDGQEVESPEAGTQHSDFKDGSSPSDVEDLMRRMMQMKADREEELVQKRLKDKGFKPSWFAELPRLGLEIRWAGVKGNGLFASKAIDAGVFTIDDFGGVINFHSAMGQTNDAAAPDFLSILTKCDDDVDKMVSLFQDYRAESLASANIDSCSFVNENDREIHFMVKSEYESGPPPYDGSKMCCRVLRLIASGEELVRHYGLDWVAEAYGGFCIGVDTWPDDEKWQLLDMQKLLPTSNFRNSTRRPSPVETDLSWPDGFTDKKYGLWASRDECLKFTDQLRKLFLALFIKLDNFEERASAKYMFNSQCQMRACSASERGKSSVAKTVNLKC